MSNNDPPACSRTRWAQFRFSVVLGISLSECRENHPSLHPPMTRRVRYIALLASDFIIYVSLPRFSAIRPSSRWNQSLPLSPHLSLIAHLRFRVCSLNLLGLVKPASHLFAPLRG